MFKTRATFNHAVRSFFDSKDYMEVETPLLSPFLIPEAAIEVFKTDYLKQGTAALPLYLIPSPELWMKRIITNNRRNIYQICKCFRNSEQLSQVHNPEFSMLEWYTVHADYIDSMKHAEELITYLHKCLKLKPLVSFGNEQISLEPPFLRISMDEIFNRVLGITLDDLDDYNNLRQSCLKHDLMVSSDDSWEQLFHKLFLSCIEPHLPQNKPLFLYDYPDRIPTLAKQKQGGLYAERWELYIGGIEIANCYTEETDQEKILKFYKGEVQRKQQSLVNHDIDWGLLDFLSHFPPCSGVALGMDRLLMIVYEISHIKEVMFSSFHEMIRSGKL
ncbi:MAG: elongation factor P--(R)-beta-lysine ligase [Spirochaetales bacterium]|nr:elongation factor P--(R)-beta-lysine ligase [Spirochaetales bacterium]